MDTETQSNARKRKHQETERNDGKRRETTTDDVVPLCVRIACCSGCILRTTNRDQPLFDFFIKCSDTKLHHRLKLPHPFLYSQNLACLTLPCVPWVERPSVRLAVFVFALSSLGVVIRPSRRSIFSSPKQRLRPFRPLSCAGMLHV